MFKKNTSSADVKKSQQKCVDPKKDTPTRLKHLRTVLDNCEVSELKAFLDANYSPVFYVFYDAFILFETQLRQKGFSVQQRPHREDLELALLVLERLLCLLPQLFTRRWQCNALTHVFRKLLHLANNIRLRREGCRLFILWYMIVGESKSPDMDAMFASLVPGFPTPPPRAVLPTGGPEGNKVSSVEPQPIIPSSSTDKTPDDITAYFLSSLLDFMVTQVRKVEWRGGNKAEHCHSAFSYLFSMFRAVYLPYIFPNFNPNNSLYHPNLELPELRSSPGKSLYGTCQVVLVRWVRQYVSTTTVLPTTASPAALPRPPHAGEERRGEAGSQEGTGSTSDQDSVSSAHYANDASAGEEARLVREVLLSTRANVDFIHELFRQALCLSFRYSEAIKTVILCYRDWIQMSGDVPVFLLEPHETDIQDDLDSVGSVGDSVRRARSDSYLVAMNRDGHVRAGLQNVLQVFVTSAANVFLLQVSPDYPLLLDEQVEHCKHVLNTYRYMVMNTRMERKTWEQLLIVLFHITSQTLSGRHVKPKEDSLGGRFASALFQTLIVSWIKANLSVVVGGELWDQLLSTLSSLSHWDELVKEWAVSVIVGSSDQYQRRRMNSSSSSQRSTTGIINPSVGGGGGGHHQDIALPSCPHRHYHNHHHHQYHHNCPRRIVRVLSDSNLLVKKVYGELSRSPSPSPSSVIESSSMKDSPMQLDFGGDTASIDTCEGVSCDQQSVMAGGSVRGWLPDVAVVLWKRVLGLLGDPNNTAVASPAINSQVFSHLTDLTNTLIKLRDNQGISLDNQSTPAPPELVPPITMIAPWCFKALNLPNAYQRGKLSAYRLLCSMLVRRHDLQPSRDLLTAFYGTLHQGLLGQDQEVISCLVGACGPHFFSLGLPGSSMLMLDFIFAANTVVAAPESKQGGVYPREEAISLLGSLLPLASLSPTVPVLQPQHGSFTLMNCSDVKDHILTVLLKSGKRDGYWRTRCLALCALASSLYHQLNQPPPHPRLNDSVNVLLAALKIGRLVGQVAADLLMLLCEHSAPLLQHYPDLPPRIIQVLCQTLSVIGGSGSISCSSSAGCEDQHLVLSVLFCLTEWVLKLPHEVLVTPSQLDGVPLLRHVFKVLHVVSTGGESGSVLSKVPPVHVPDFSSAVREDSPRDSRSDTLKRAQAGLTPGVSTTVRLAARTMSQHLLNHLWHFPLGVGAQRLSSLVVESDDLPGCTSEELTGDVFLSPHVQLFTLNNNCLFSMVQLPALHGPGPGVAGFATPSSEVRLIMRDLSGKFTWDASLLCAPPPDALDCSNSSGLPSLDDTCSTQHEHSPPAPPAALQDPRLVAASVVGASTHELHLSRDDLMSTSVVGAPLLAPRNMTRRRPTGYLPSHQDSAHDLDNLDDLLSYIGHTSPEVLEQVGGPLNEATAPPPSLPVALQHDAIATTLAHRNAVQEFIVRNTHTPQLQCPEEECPVSQEESSPFQQCRLLFDQLGLAAWEKRTSLHTLKKNDKLLREIKNLDNQKCRETHKIAVLYVAEGQEDKMSILANSGGSQRFEEFVGGLGWEVELSTHTGFLGGLHRNGSTGDTAPYYATSLTETIFHVSTRMPSHTEQSLLLKTRHLGNDEVHIVWSEHTRDYRRGIIPTEFCDVLIVIYPLDNSLHRMQISSKPDVPFFGPLFDGALVGRRELPHLVRATAINASRAKRSRLPLYQNFYEERARALHAIIEQHSEATTFENFISAVHCPVFPAAFPGGPTRTSGTSFCPRTAGDERNPSDPTNIFFPAESSSGLAAALLLEGGACGACGSPSGGPHHGGCSGGHQGSPHHQRPPLTRPTSYSTGEQHNLREKARKVKNVLGTLRRHSAGTTSSSAQHNQQQQYDCCNDPHDCDGENQPPIRWYNKRRHTSASVPTYHPLDTKRKLSWAEFSVNYEFDVEDSYSAPRKNSLVDYPSGRSGHWNVTDEINLTSLVALHGHVGESSRSRKRSASQLEQNIKDVSDSSPINTEICASRSSLTSLCINEEDETISSESNDEGIGPIIFKKCNPDKFRARKKQDRVVRRRKVAVYGTNVNPVPAELSKCLASVEPENKKLPGCDDDDHESVADVGEFSPRFSISMLENEALCQAAATNNSKEVSSCSDISDLPKFDFCRRISSDTTYHEFVGSCPDPKCTSSIETSNFSEYNLPAALVKSLQNASMKLGCCLTKSGAAANTMTCLVPSAPYIGVRLFHSESAFSSVGGQRLGGSSGPLDPHPSPVLPSSGGSGGAPSPRSNKKLSFKNPSRRISGGMTGPSSAGPLPASVASRTSEGIAGSTNSRLPESPVPPPRKQKDVPSSINYPQQQQHHRMSVQQQKPMQHRLTVQHPQQQHNRNK
ncbi:Rap GTPase activating protein domain [Trinorchestia longiramus]|nr:Rap GTPase activating protein domain [Trinorchestia longiramus]